MPLTDLIAKIPSEVWAAITGSALTLGGVLLTNWNSRRQLMESLKFEATQRDREREMALKRDIYVPAAEGVNRLLRLIYGLNDLSLTNEQMLLEQREASTAIAKLQVVGSNELIQATNVFMHAFNLAYMVLILKRSPLVDNKQKMEMLDGVLRNVNQDQDRLVEYMRQANLSGHPDQHAKDMLNQSFQYGQSRRKDLSEQIHKIWMEQRRGSIVLSETSFAEGLKLSGLVPPMLFAARRELEMPINEATFMEQYEAYKQKGEDAFKLFLEEAAKIAGKELDGKTQP